MFYRYFAKGMNMGEDVSEANEASSTVCMVMLHYSDFWVVRYVSFLYFNLIHKAFLSFCKIYRLLTPVNLLVSFCVLVFQQYGSYHVYMLLL